MTVLIGIAPDIHYGQKLYTRAPDEHIVMLWDYYLKAILDQGEIPVLLPITDDEKLIKEMAARMDGVILPGGAFDIPPDYYGEEEKPWLGDLKPDRSWMELSLLREAMKRDMPTLGICGGMQLINVAYGGTLYQDILEERPESRDHQQDNKRTSPSHQVKVRPDTKLSSMIGAKGKSPYRLMVNSTHHQGVKEVGKGLVISAVATDGIVEGVESPDHTFLVGVQWHPEMLQKKFAPQRGIFTAFINEAKKYKRKKSARK